jgi:serine kinase of HPr protein (carbohydrate metabolism regulator)
VEERQVADAPEAHTTHGTAIALCGRGALIVGASGAGKSDLALRCLTLGPSALTPAPAQLVADDRVIVSPHAGGLQVSAPATIRGRLEVRGIGILEVSCVESADLVLIVELAEAAAIERLPDPQPRRAIHGVSLPVLRLAPFEASAPAKLLLALARAH